MEVAIDKIPLPSKGIQYKQLPEENRGYVEIAYMTAEDENLFFSPNLIESDTLIETLVNRKLKTKGLTYYDLLEGDLDAILFWLRSTAYGADYSIKLRDPKTDELFDHVVDLSGLTYLEPDLTLNDRGNLEFKLPVSNRVIDYKYLTVSETSKLEKDDEAKMVKMKSTTGSAISTLLTDKLSMNIVAIDGTITDPMQIRQFVNNMSPRDSRAFRKHLTDNRIGVDTKIEVMAPSGAVFRGTIPVDITFFYPDLSL